MKMSSGYAVPVKAGGGYDYDQVLTTLMAQFYPAGMLGVGLTALMASFMSGMAGNVTAFNTVFTYDIYQSYIRKRRAGQPLSVGGPRHDGRRRRCSRSAPRIWRQRFNNIMDLLQLVFALCERAAVCDVSAGHVLEAHHRARRIFRLADRD